MFKMLEDMGARLQADIAVSRRHDHPLVVWLLLLIPCFAAPCPFFTPTSLSTFLPPFAGRKEGARRHGRESAQITRGDMHTC